MLILHFSEGMHNVWFVSDSGSNDSDCQSESTPCKNLQTVLDRASDGADIYVTSDALSLGDKSQCHINNSISYRIRSLRGTAVNVTCSCQFLLLCPLRGSFSEFSVAVMGYSFNPITFSVRHFFSAEHEIHWTANDTTEEKGSISPNFTTIEIKGFLFNTNAMKFDFRVKAGKISFEGCTFMVKGLVISLEDLSVKPLPSMENAKFVLPNSTKQHTVEFCNTDIRPRENETPWSL